jgi:uncharacterized membrane protein
MKNESESKKNIVLGVTLPYAHLKDDDVLAIRKKYIRCLNLITIIFILFVPIPFFIHSFSINFTIWMMWLLGIIFATAYPYIKYNKQLKNVKYEKKWIIENVGCTIVDMKAVTEQIRTVRVICFLPPIIVSIAPVIYEILNRMGTKNFGIRILPLLLISAISILFLGVALLMDHQRTETISTNSDINSNYTRAKKRCWTKCWLYACWLNAGYTIAFFAYLDGIFKSVILFVGFTALYTIGIILVSVISAIRIYRIKHRILPDNQTEVPNDEDDYWIMGMFYYNPNSNRTMVEKRVGIGTTVNMATKLGKVLTSIGILSLLIIPVCCIWLMFEEFTPINVELKGNKLISEQWKEEYVIPLNEIDEVTLLNDLPSLTKISGMGLDNLKKGKFSVEGYGDCEICLYSKKEVFLVVKANDNIYILSDSNDKDTMYIYEELVKNIDNTDR